MSYMKSSSVKQSFLLHIKFNAFISWRELAFASLSNSRDVANTKQGKQKENRRARSGEESGGGKKIHRLLSTQSPRLFRISFLLNQRTSALLSWNMEQVRREDAITN